MTATIKGFRNRLDAGQTIICADGYKSELSRRGFLRDGEIVSQAVLEFPTQVRQLHEEFVHCGSDVVVACCGHDSTAMLSLDDDDDDNDDDDVYNARRNSLRIARGVADESGTLTAGRVDSTGCKYDETARERIEQLLTSRVKLAVEERADFILGGMFRDTREAKLAVDCIKHYGQGIPSVMTLSIGCQGKTTDDVSVPEALHALEVAGADVVGLACDRGPSTLMPLIREARKLCKGPLAAIPTAYRTKEGEESLASLTDTLSGHRLYPRDIDQALCNRKDITKFALETKSLGLQFIGLCCGAPPSFIRELSDVYERTTKASRFKFDLLQTNMFKPNPSPHRTKITRYQRTREWK